MYIRCHACLFLLIVSHTGSVPCSEIRGSDIGRAHHPSGPLLRPTCVSKSMGSKVYSRTRIENESAEGWLQTRAKILVT